MHDRLATMKNVLLLFFLLLGLCSSQHGIRKAAEVNQEQERDLQWAEPSVLITAPLDGEAVEKLDSVVVKFEKVNRALRMNVWSLQLYNTFGEVVGTERYGMLPMVYSGTKVFNVGNLPPGRHMFQGLARLGIFGWFGQKATNVVWVNVTGITNEPVATDTLDEEPVV